MSGTPPYYRLKLLDYRLKLLAALRDRVKERLDL